MKTTASLGFSLLCWLALSFTLFAQSTTPLAANGRLKVVNRQLTSELGKAVQLRGMSSHGLQWFGQCYPESALRTLASDWGRMYFGRPCTSMKAVT